MSDHRDPSAPARVAVIGLGKMGAPIARRLLAAGHEVRGNNRSRRAAEELAAEGMVATGSAAEAARTADVVLTALPTLAAVEQVYGELAAVARAGQVFVDHSTVSPALSRWCADQLRPRDAAFVDAPVSGGPEGAAAGTLSIMIGGDEATIDAALPVLRAYGGLIRRCGELGTGQAAKLVNQLLVALHAAAISEAVALGAAMGVDIDVLAELLPRSYGGSVIADRNMQRIRDRDFTGTTSIDVLLKDLDIITGQARERGVPLLLGGVTAARFLEARGRGLGDLDIAALVNLWEAGAGLGTTPLHADVPSPKEAGEIG